MSNEASLLYWRLLQDGIQDPFFHFAVEEALLRKKVILWHQHLTTTQAYLGKVTKSEAIRGRKSRDFQKAWDENV